MNTLILSDTHMHRMCLSTTRYTIGKHCSCNVYRNSQVIFQSQLTPPTTLTSTIN